MTAAPRPAVAGAHAAPIVVRRVDFADPAHGAALVALLDGYARDPMGGATPLPAATRATLVERFAAVPGAASWIAWHDADGTPVGLLNAFIGFSTFKAQPLLNVHDLAVDPAWRGLGIARALLAEAERHARALGCCKLTLEVLSGNGPALALYEHVGFADYALDPAHGEARLMQKWL